MTIHDKKKCHSLRFRISGRSKKFIYPKKVKEVAIMVKKMKKKKIQRR
jgi:hypothetical protein